MSDDRREVSGNDGDPRDAKGHGISLGAELARARERASLSRGHAAVNREGIADERDESSAQRDDSSSQRDESSVRRDESSVRRDESSVRRDEFSSQRDKSSALRDRRAEGHDLEADELDDRDELADRHTLRVEELRGRGQSGRRRAASNRERSRQDRVEATRDRRHSVSDRAHAGSDRQHSEDDREHAGEDRQRSEDDREHAGEDRGHASNDRSDARDDRECAGTDDLTGARRRGVGLEELDNEIQRARRESGGRLVAAFCDVDGLKSVNDIDGHAEGDALLRAFADGLRRQIRSYDLFVRLGGDEFLCALPNVTLVEARERFDRLRADLAGSGGSVSVGYAELRDGDSAEDLVSRADGALLAGRGHHARR